MSDHSRQQRQTATQDFMQSLGQLESVLQAEVAIEPPATKTTTAEPVTIPEAVVPAAEDESHELTNLEAALEAAAADIEQYMNDHEE